MFAPFAKCRVLMSHLLVIAAVCTALASVSRVTSAFLPQSPAAVPDDNAGFTSIFDGKTMDGWDGDPAFWRAEDGSLIAESTPEKVVRSNTFLIWRGGTVRDFELKLEFRLSSEANSGIQYRSALVPEVSRWAMKGYQADLDGANSYTGMVYEERGRGFLAPRGQFSRMTEDRELKLISTLGEADVLKGWIRAGEWNQMHVIAKGNLLLHIINGHVMAAFIDEDSKGMAIEGLLGLQLHQGKPMKIEFRNIHLKKIVSG